MNEQDGKHVLGVSCKTHLLFVFCFFLILYLWFLVIITLFSYFIGESRNDT